MTIRDISVAFGFDVDRASQSQAENSIKGLKNMATKLLGKIAVAFSVTKLTQFGKECMQVASDVEQMELKFEQVFNNDHGLEKEVDKWAEDYAASIGRNKNTIKGYLADQQNLLVGFGMTREAGAELSEQMTSLALDIASFANQDETIAVNAMTKAVMGETEAARTLGAVLNDSTRAETMHAMGIEGKFDKLSQLDKMMVNYNAILRQSPDAIGDCVNSMGSYESSMRQLKASQENFKETIGKQFLPVMSFFVQGMTKGVRAATNFATALLQDEDGGSRIVKAFEAAKGVLAQFAPVVEKVRSAASGAWEFISKRVSETWDSITGRLSEAWGWIKDTAPGVFSAVRKAVEENIGPAVETISKTWGLVSGALSEAWGWIKDTAPGVFSAVRKAVDEHLGPIIESVRKAFDGVVTILSVLWDNASGIISIVIGAIQSLKEHFDIEGVIEKAASALDSFLSVIGDVGEWISEHKGVMDTLVVAIGSIAAAIGIVKAALLAYNIVAGVCQAISAAMAGGFSLASAAGGVLAGVIGFITSPVTIAVAAIAALIAIGVLLYKNWGTIKEYAVNIWNGIKEFISGVLGWISDLFHGIWDGITSFLATKWDTIASTVTNALNSAYSTIKSVLQSIHSYFSSIFSQISSFVRTTFSSIYSGVASQVTNIKNSIVDGFNEAIDFIKGLPEQAIQWGSDFINGLRDGIESGVKGITGAVKGVGEKISSFLHFSAPDEGPLSDYETWMPDFMGGLAKGIKDNEGAVLDNVRSLAGGITALMQGATASPGTAVSSQVNNSTSNMTQNVNISNSYSGGSAETQRNVAKAMKKSAVDATTQMARGLAYARG